MGGAGEGGVCGAPTAPAQVKAYARSCGKRAKTDRLDASLIAAFMAERPGLGRVLPSEDTLKIKGLSAKRRQLLAMQKALPCQTKQHRDADIQSLDAALDAVLDAQIEALDHALATLIKGRAALARRAALLCSVTGIGKVILTTLLAEMPELGTLTAKTAAALAGLAPMARDSGKFGGKRFIQGGHEVVRTALHPGSSPGQAMASMVASTHDPQMETFATGLKVRGKSHKQAMIAVARKLIIAANAVLKRQTEWVKVVA